MLTELKDARSTLVVKPHFSVPFYIGIYDLNKELKKDSTREDIDAASKKYEEEQRKKEEYRRKKAKEIAEQKALGYKN